MVDVVIGSLKAHSCDALCRLSPMENWLSTSFDSNFQHHLCIKTSSEILFEVIPAFLLSGLSRILCFMSRWLRAEILTTKSHIIPL